MFNIGFAYRFAVAWEYQAYLYAKANKEVKDEAQYKAQTLQTDTNLGLEQMQTGILIFLYVIIYLIIFRYFQYLSLSLAA